jgi:mono/diheme cytochrome c family protein
MKASLLCLPLILVVALASSAATGQDPDELASERRVAERSLRENCLICHTPAMVEHQRLAPAAWAAEVDKMIGWGAPVRPEEKGALIQLLATTYTTDRPPAELERISAEEVRALDRLPPPEPLDADAKAGAALYATHCASCHGEEARGGDQGNNLVLNPALVDRDAYTRVVREGRGKMPAFAEVLKAGPMDEILAWLRARPLPEP